MEIQQENHALNHPLNNNDYNAFQLILPLDLAVMIAKDDPIRSFVNVLEGAQLEKFLKRPSKGRQDYQDFTLLKILLFAQMNQIYTLRAIEQACRTDIRFIWLAGGITPSHMTFQRLINQRLNGRIEDIFVRINQVLIEKEDIDTSVLYIDGTKIEANATKNSFVWKKATIKHRQNLFVHISELLASMGLETKTHYSSDELLPIWMNLLNRIQTEQIELVKGKGHHKPLLQKQYEQLKQHWEKLCEHEKRLTICGERNSYSKTDSDATMLHMKEDYYMKTGIFKPGYNLQIGVSDEYVMCAQCFPNPTDTLTFIPMLEHFKNLYGYYPKIPVADAGYGSYDNYLFCLSQQMELYQKYSNYESEKNGRYRKDSFYGKAMLQPDGSLRCPNGKGFHLKEEKVHEHGRYPRYEEVYVCEDCDGCPFATKCKKSEHNRTVRMNRILLEMQAAAKENLDSPRGIQLRMQRSAQAESTFGIIKSNWGKSRFTRRGKKNVENELLLMLIGYNLMKFHKKSQRGQFPS